MNWSKVVTLTAHLSINNPVLVFHQGLAISRQCCMAYLRVDTQVGNSHVHQCDKNLFMKAEQFKPIFPVLKAWNSKI